MDWAGLDFAWNYTKSKGYLFKGHTFVWGQQIPYWVAGLSAADQAYQVEEWIKLYCQRYPDYQLIDVVNEPLHETPNYANSIGGTGATGWDWVIWAYQKARQYCPNAKLLINEYDVLNNDGNLAKYIQIINLLKARSLIDGIGEQAHHFEYTSMTQLQTNLNTLAATNLPIYISELDFDLGDNTQHLNRMKQVVPLFYEHPSVKGITFWGYIRGDTWLGGSWLYDQSATGSTGTSTATCTTQNLQTNIPLTLGIWNDYTVTIPTPGKIRAVFVNDGAANS
jgi:endo-1,4-beta-xylanase